MVTTTYRPTTLLVTQDLLRLGQLGTADVDQFISPRSKSALMTDEMFLQTSPVRVRLVTKRTVQTINNVIRVRAGVRRVIIHCFN
jgi:hypothetical protein